MYKEEITTVKNYFQNIFCKQKIVLYGAGKMAKRTYSFINDYFREDIVDNFVVEDVSSNPCELFGIQVIDWHNIIGKEYKVIIALASPMNEKVKKWLIFEGIDETRLYTIDNKILKLLSKRYPLLEYNEREQYSKLFSEWIYLKNNTENSNIAITSYPKLQRKDSISVYGYGYVGKRLVEELENNGVEIAYIIDSKAYQCYVDIDTYTLNDDIPDCDLIIVSEICEYDSLLTILKSKTNAFVVSLENIIDYLYFEV